MTKATRSDRTPAQVMMTLSAIAATAATPRPSGETLPAQTERARLGIEEQLDNAGLATGEDWQLMWLALSPDNANLAYIAFNGDGTNEIAVAVRGTVGNATDMMEDLDVGTVVPFTAGGSPDIAVSAGAMAAFTQIVNARGVTATPGRAGGSGGPGSTVPTNATLTEALLALVQLRFKPQPTVYVTGHSLGGCVATMLAAHLQTLAWQPVKPRFALVTFAAPTAGAQSFAKYVDSLPWELNERWYNAYDLVPRAWNDLDAADDWYPAPGPAANGEVGLLLTFKGLTKGNAYVQPGTERRLNEDYARRDDGLVNKTSADFLGQVAFQHANSTYLGLLDAPGVPAGPVVTEISPTSGQGGTPVTITGEGFVKDGSGVDFGPVPAGTPTVSADGKRITVTAPGGHGLVDVRVTTNLGTSPAVPMGRFAYDGGPEPVVVRGVTPRGGKVGTPVTIDGSGFLKGASAQVKDVPLTDVSVVSSTRITAKMPLHQADWPKTVDITVTVGVATSPTGPADEFTYPV